MALRDEVSAALTTLAADAAVKAVIVTGAGDTFPAGFDLQEFQRLAEPDDARALWDSSSTSSARSNASPRGVTRFGTPAGNGARGGTTGSSHWSSFVNALLTGPIPQFPITTCRAPRVRSHASTARM